MYAIRSYYELTAHVKGLIKVGDGDHAIRKCCVLNVESLFISQRRDGFEPRSLNGRIDCSGKANEDCAASYHQNVFRQHMHRDF